MILITCLLIPVYQATQPPERNRVHSFVHGTQGKEEREKREEGRK